MRVIIVSSGLIALLILSAVALPYSSERDDSPFTYVEGGIVRGDSDEKALALIFSGDQFADGAAHIRKVLAEDDVKASFFFTGNFYRNPEFASVIRGLKADGHYLGGHSDRHLLYCRWEDRDDLLVTKAEFLADIEANYREMARFGIEKAEARYFLPPYEWYNARISDWARDSGLTLINFTPGTTSNADYTTPAMGEGYKSSAVIYQNILAYEKRKPHGLNGFLLLTHIGTSPQRTDKFYRRLGELITTLKERGYRFERVDVLLAD